MLDFIDATILYDNYMLALVEFERFVDGLRRSSPVVPCSGFHQEFVAPLLRQTPKQQVAGAIFKNSDDLSDKTYRLRATCPCEL